MNVYLRSIAEQLGAVGIDVDVFTRATHPGVPQIVTVSNSFRVIHCNAGPYEGLAKEDLPTQLVAFTRAVLEFERTSEVRYDVLHSHYWLSGQVAWLLHDLWEVPWVHTAHTLASVKNSYLAQGDTPEPESRRICEQQIVDHADALVVNTSAEYDDLIVGYDAEPSHIHVITPGADIECFTPGSDRATERTRRELGIPLRDRVVGFVGRLQRLKGPQVLLRAMAQLMRENPGAALRVVFCGGASGAGPDSREALEELAVELGVASKVRFLSPRPAPELAYLYQALDVVAVPSYNESFGLVALEAQACGTPVVATRVGGLPIAVDEGTTGLLVDGHDPQEWARVLGQLLFDDARRIRMGEDAPAHAAGFSWAASAEATAELYRSLSGHQRYAGAHES